MGRRRNLSDLVRFGRLSVRLDGFVVSEPEFRFRELRNFHTRNLSELIRFGRFSVRVDGILGLEPEFYLASCGFTRFPQEFYLASCGFTRFPQEFAVPSCGFTRFTSENYPPNLTGTDDRGVYFLALFTSKSPSYPLPMFLCHVFLRRKKHHRHRLPRVVVFNVIYKHKSLLPTTVCLCHAFFTSKN